VRTRLSAAFGVALLLILVALPAVAPAIARNGHEARNAAAAARARHEAIVAHWTEARLRSARPRDLRVVDGTALGHLTKQGRGKPGGSTAVTGASWTGGGPIVKASGKVYFDMAGSAWVCSGTVAGDATTSTNTSLVLTAGHCAYDETNAAFATNWLFIPDFDTAPTFTCGSTSLGCWTAQALVVDAGYATSGSFNTQASVNDFAFAVVGPGGKSGTAQLDVAAGSLPMAYGAVSSGSVVYAFGYPASGKYHGNDLTYCSGAISPDSLNQNMTWGMTCDMTGGSSGGPWLAGSGASSGSGTLSSLNSYGYSGVKSMYGPKFNVNTQRVYSAADGATVNTIVACDAATGC
jgi:V8-like Glu-specific endopeptidase